MRIEFEIKNWKVCRAEGETAKKKRSHHTMIYVQVK